MAAARATAPLSSPLVRRANVWTVLKVLQRLGTASRVELARETGLTSTTAYRLVEHLNRLGLVITAEVEPAREGAGRRPAGYQFNRQVAVIAAIDVGNETTRVALGDATGAIVGIDESPTVELSHNLAASLSTRIGNLRGGSARLGRLVGASVGIAAIVDRESGTVVKASQHGEWDGVPLRDQLVRALGCPASVAQDDHLAALAEFSSLEGAVGTETLVVVNQGKGVGAGFIVNGRPFVGAHGAAGRLENWEVPGEAETALLGDTLTADALVRSYTQSGGARSVRDGKDLCDAARAGEPAAVHVIRQLATRLGKVFLQLAVAFDPDVMIFGGGFAGSHELFEPEIRRALSSRPRPPQFLVSRLGEQAVVLGAMQSGLEHVDRYLTEVLDAA